MDTTIDPMFQALNGKEVNGAVETPRAKTLANPPTRVFPHGNVRVAVWVNKTPWGDIDWKWEIRRLYTGPNGNHRLSYSLEFWDMWHAIRAIYKAYRWVKARRRRLRFINFVSWS